MRTKYRFSHRSDNGLAYYWEAVSLVPGDSRVEQIKCSVAYFWGYRPQAKQEKNS